MKKQRINFDEFNRLVSKLARDITVSGWRPDYIVGITRGGLIPAVMLSHYFNVPCNTLKVSLRDSGDCESNLWMAEDAFGYQDGESVELQRRNILLVDDINDTGATINWILDDWPSSCRPSDPAWSQIWGNNVKFAVIVDNLASGCREAMNFSALEIDKSQEDVWIDFPYESWWQ
jgi:hypoxanthine phosphoribosyltransferase